MIKFDIITIFPAIFKSYINESLIKKAIEKKIISVNVHNLRDWADDKQKTVDDRPFGGGLGMVIKIEPIFKAVFALKKSQTNPKAKIQNSKIKVILFTPRGKRFTQKLAHKLSKLDQIIFICGRYEGVDERVAKKIADLELSIGDYDLMGGELPAMVVIEAVSRLIPGVIRKKELLNQRITEEGGFIEYPQYTRPEVFDLRKYIKNWKSCPSKFRKTKTWRVPKVLLSGNHKKIEKWRLKHGKVIGKENFL